MATGFGLSNSGMMRLGLNVMQKVAARSPEKGAETSIYLATSPKVEGVSGRCFQDKHESTPSATVQDAEAARQLWQLSEEQTGLKEAIGD
ncbi:MAG TPA: hypothetical protein VGK87_16515 [Anaerolineae bacterium]